MPSQADLTFTTLNLGGPHVSKKRLAGRLAKIDQQQPVCVALQEVRFKSGSNHMALMSQLLQWFVSPYHRTQTVDVMMLVHNRISTYTTLLLTGTPHAMAVRVQLPGKLLFNVINHHGSFTRKDREVMDEWFTNVPEVDVFMGDLNDTVWPSTRGDKRCGIVHYNMGP